MFESVLFDFDGVLVDSFQFHVDKINGPFGLDLPADVYYKMHTGNFHAEKQGAEGAQPADWYAYQDLIHEDAVQQKLHTSLPSFLKKLAANSRLFVVSSGGQRGINGFLKHHGIDTYFTAVLGHETSTSKYDKFLLLHEKYDVSFQDTIFVTDTVGDIKEAQSVPLPVIAVDFGSHTRADLEAANPDHLCSNWDEVEAVLQGTKPKVAEK